MTDSDAQIQGHSPVTHSILAGIGKDGANKIALDAALADRSELLKKYEEKIAARQYMISVFYEIVSILIASKKDINPGGSRRSVTISSMSKLVKLNQELSKSMGIEDQDILIIKKNMENAMLHVFTKSNSVLLSLAERGLESMSSPRLLFIMTQIANGDYNHILRKSASKFVTSSVDLMTPASIKPPESQFDACKRMGRAVI